MKKNVIVSLLIILIVIIGVVYKSNDGVAGNQPTSSVEEYQVCDENGKRYPSEKAALDDGLDYPEFGATFCPEYKMHPSWDADLDGINDCEKEGICDGVTDYSQPRGLKE